jgi:hypothetical protein
LRCAASPGRTRSAAAMSSQRGGKRKGAGRPLAGHEPRRPATVWITATEREQLRREGDGNVSEGVRRVLARRNET